MFSCSSIHARNALDGIMNLTASAAASTMTAVTLNSEEIPSPSPQILGVGLAIGVVTTIKGALSIINVVNSDPAEDRNWCKWGDEARLCSGVISILTGVTAIAAAVLGTGHAYGL